MSIRLPDFVLKVLQASFRLFETITTRLLDMSANCNFVLQEKPEKVCHFLKLSNVILGWFLNVKCNQHDLPNASNNVKHITIKIKSWEKNYRTYLYDEMLYCGHLRPPILGPCYFFSYGNPVTCICDGTRP